MRGTRIRPNVGHTSTLRSPLLGIIDGVDPTRQPYCASTSKRGRETRDDESTTFAEQHAPIFGIDYIHQAALPQRQPKMTGWRMRPGLVVGVLCYVVALAFGGENAPGTTGLLESTVGGKRTLVVADGPRIKDSHSMFLDSLQV